MYQQHVTNQQYIAIHIAIIAIHIATTQNIAIYIAPSPHIAIIAIHIATTQNVAMYIAPSPHIAIVIASL